jgi:hypothetical protein
MVTLTFTSEVIGELTLTAVAGQFWALPFVIYLYAVDINSINRWVAWIFMTLSLSYPSGRSCSGLILGLYPAELTDYDSTSNPSCVEFPELKYCSLKDCICRYV